MLHDKESNTNIRFEIRTRSENIGILKLRNKSETLEQNGLKLIILNAERWRDCILLK